jgi:hypothetical protein
MSIPFPSRDPGKVHRMSRQPRARQLIARLLVALACLGATPCWATWIVPPTGYRAKDFAVVKHNGQFHVFYILHQTGVPNDQTERELGHAVSNDLWIWTELDPVIPARDDAWDSDHIWAPSIIERDSVFFLFYTGVADDPGGARNWQRTGVATSSDLVNWNRMDAPILTCLDVPWSWCDSLNLNTAFRDPSVLADPEHPGKWLMAFSTYPAGDTANMVAALASSDGDPLQWGGVIPLWVSHIGVTGHALVESPTLFHRDSLYYLFFTANATQPLQWATSPALSESASVWTYHGALGDMLNEDTGAWFASEVFSDGLIDYFGFVRGDRIDIRRISWLPDGRFNLGQPSPFHVTSVGWTTAAVQHHDVASFRIESVNAWGAYYDYELVTVAPDGSELSYPPAQFGAPSRIWVASPVVDVSWTVSALPDSLPDGTYPRMKVRSLDRTNESPAIEVRRAPGGSGGPDPPPSGGPKPVNSPPQAGTPPPTIKPLDIADFGATTLRVDLPAAAHARVEVFDVAGRRVRTITSRTFGAGTNVVVWDGRGDAGEAARRGLYFARLTTDAGVRASTRFVIR